MHVAQAEGPFGLALDLCRLQFLDGVTGTFPALPNGEAAAGMARRPGAVGC